MAKKLLLLLTALVLAPAAVHAQSMSGGRYQVTMTVLPNGRVLIAGGIDASGAPVTKAEIYDPVKRSFSTTGSMVIRRARHTATLLKNGQVLVVGGYDGVNGLASAELFNPNTGVWQLADGTMSAPRYRHTATLRPLDGTVVVIGGFSDSDGILGSIEVYDPDTKTFTRYTGTLTPRYDHSAVLLNDLTSILVAGGIIDVQNTPTSSAQKLTGTTWASAGSMSVAHSGATAGMKPDGTVLVAGGATDSGGTSTAVVDRWTGGTSWAAVASLPTPRKFHTAVMLADGRFALSGGFGANFTKSVAFNVAPLAGAGSAAIGTLAFSPDCLLVTGPPCTGLSFNNGQASFSFSNLLLSAGMSGQLMVSELSLTGSKLETSSVVVTGLTSAVNDMVTNTPITKGNFNASVTLNLTGGSVATSTYPVSSPVELAGAAVTIMAGSLHVTQAVYSDVVLGDNTGWIFNTEGNLGAAVFFPNSVVLANGTALVCGGIDSNGTPSATCTLFKSDHATFANATAAQAQRQAHSATMLPDGTVLIAGGDNGSTLLNTAAISVLNGTTGDVTGFTTTGSMWCSRKNHTAVLLQDGKVLVCGGVTDTVSTFCAGASPAVPTSSCELFSAGAWTKWAPMLDARTNGTSTLLFTGQVLAVGGVDVQGAAISGAELYDPYLITWTATQPLGLSRYQHTASLLEDGRVVVAGGRKLEPIGVSEVYDPRLGTWSSAVMIKKRYLHSATFLPDGRLLIAGGLDIFGFPLNDVELFDPANSRWNGGNAMNERHAEQNGTLLPNGKLILTGGSTGFDNTSSTTTVEVFQESSWNLYRDVGQPRMIVKRSRHTSTLLNNGKVLLIGGWNGASVNNSFEMAYMTNQTPNANQPVITSLSTGTVVPGGLVTITGNKFTGVSEGAGGMNYNSGGYNHPRVLMRPFDSGTSGTQSGSSFITDVTTSVFTESWNDTTLSFRAPSGRGFFQIAVQAGGMTSKFASILVNPVDVPVSTTALIGTALGISSVSWTWNTVPFSTSYDILRAADDQLLTNVAVQTYVQTNMGPNEAAAQIKVRGKSSTGTGPASVASPIVYTLAAAPPKPTVIYGTSKAMKVAWTANGNPDGTRYNVQIAKDPGFDTGLVQATTTSLELRVEGTTPLTTFYARVQAINALDVLTAFSPSTNTVTSLGDIIDATIDRSLVNTVSTLLSSNRTVRMIVQPETFTKDSQLVIEDSTFTPCGSIPAAVHVTVSGDQQPGRAVTMSLTYLASDVVGIDQSRLLFMRYDPIKNVCVPLRSAVDTSTKSVTALVDHFSTYQIALSTPASTLDGAKAWPNPLMASRAGQSFITFKPLPVGTDVTVYTMRGELVYKTSSDATGTAMWPATNRNGVKSASGIYMVVLDSGASTKVIKVGIER